MLGVAFSTVVGKLMMIGRAGPASQARVAALQASSATGSSVMLKVSGEYSSTHSVSGCASVSCLISPTCFVMSCITSGTLMPNTTRRHTGAVALYTCTMARRAPRKLSIVANQFLARLRDHHDRDVVGNQLLLDEIAHRLEIRIRRRRKAHFDFLEAHADQRLEQALLGLAAHGLEERLVAVAKVGAAPHRHRS